jgi:hypothetical protein
MFGLQMDELRVFIFIYLFIYLLTFPNGSHARVSWHQVIRVNINNRMIRITYIKIPCRSESFAGEDFEVNKLEVCKSDPNPIGFVRISEPKHSFRIDKIVS